MSLLSNLTTFWKIINSYPATLHRLSRLEAKQMATQEQVARLITDVQKQKADLQEVSNALASETTLISQQLASLRSQPDVSGDIGAACDAIEASNSTLESMVPAISQIGNAVSVPVTDGTAPTTGAASGDTAPPADGAATQNNPGEVVLNGDSAATVSNGAAAPDAAVSADAA